MRIQFRRAAGEIERGGAGGAQEGEHRVDGVAVHLLGPVRAGVDVAVQAGLVAAVAEVDLQGVDAAAANRRKVRRLHQRKGGMHVWGSVFCLLVIDPTGWRPQSLPCARAKTVGSALLP